MNDYKSRLRKELEDLNFNRNAGRFYQKRNTRKGNNFWS